MTVAMARPRNAPEKGDEYRDRQRKLWEVTHVDWRWGHVFLKDPKGFQRTPTFEQLRKWYERDA